MYLYNKQILCLLPITTKQQWYFSSYPTSYDIYYPSDKPSPPSNLRVTDIWKDYMMLVWEPPQADGGSPITGYTIEQRDAYEVGFRFVVALKEDATSYQVRLPCDHVLT